MTRDDLDRIAQDEREAQPAAAHHIRVCVAASCLSSNSDKVKTALDAAVKASPEPHRCRISGVGCLGLCKEGPKRLKTAIEQAEKLGLLGNEICGTTFNFRIDVRLGAGAFVCGEETALIASIEGNRGTPRPRPPYPAEVGLWGAPTLINNVETYAAIPAIIRNGGHWYAGIGTDERRRM